MQRKRSDGVPAVDALFVRLPTDHRARLGRGGARPG